MFKGPGRQAGRLDHQKRSDSESTYEQTVVGSNPSAVIGRAVFRAAFSWVSISCASNSEAKVKEPQHTNGLKTSSAQPV